MGEGRAGKAGTESPEVEAEAVDLNQIFPEAALDLNLIFPDREMRKFLRQIKRNRASNSRFLASFGKEKNMWEDDV